MADLVVAPMLVAFGMAAVALLLRGRWRLQRGATVAGTAVYAATIGLLAYRTVFAPEATGALAYQIGGWPAPFGITLVVDALSAFMLSMTAVVALYAAAVSVFFIDPRNQQVYYHPLFGFLLLGVTGAFLTGDLFNLFVWFETMLMASYVFVAFYGNAQHTAAAARYVVLNVLGGVFMLLSVGGLYATVGTLNMADMAVTLAEPSAIDTAPVVGFSALVLATFALKAGLVPFQFWVPSAYRAAPLPIAAMLAGVTKKVGIYAIIRVYFTVFAGASLSAPFFGGDSPLAFLAPVLLVMAAASVLVGGLGAVSRSHLDSLLAYSSIGQVGFIAAPVAVAAATVSDSLRHLALVAALIYALHHALTKSLLFFSTAVIRDMAGTTEIAELGGLADRSSTFAATFFVGGLSLMGVPPLVGFFGKFVVFEAAIARLAAVPTVASVGLLAVLLAGAFLTLVYSTRAWTECFWGAPTEAVETDPVDRQLVAVVATLAALVVLVGVGFEPVYTFADAAAEAALDTEAYVDAVDPGGDKT
ncbi:complex I subunit 5 family protein [Natronomonas sp.]|uniref:complex I subunit 5 family protein n=1 Tax=Natronomonas sp. TaxID=2184060 RepID=UPI002FC30F33